MRNLPRTTMRTMRGTPSQYGTCSQKNVALKYTHNTHVPICITFGPLLQLKPLRTRMSSAGSRGKPNSRMPSVMALLCGEGAGRV